MDKIASVLGLKRSVKITLAVEKEVFIKRMGSKIQPQRFMLFDIFDAKRNKFYGTIHETAFKVRADQGAVPGSFLASARGTFHDAGNTTELEISFLGWNWFIVLLGFWVFLLFGLAFYHALTSQDFSVVKLYIPSILVFIIGPVILMRIGINKLEKFVSKELETLNKR